MSITLTVNDFVKPIFAVNNNLIVMAIDDGYAKYCSVALISLAENVDEAQNYDIVILENVLSDTIKTSLTDLIKLKKNISLRFYNIGQLIEPYRDFIFVQSGFTIETYYRLFIVNIFSAYSKALYLDGDVLVEQDISALFTLDLQGNYAAGVKDFVILTEEKSLSHKRDVLGIPDGTKYFNAGVVLFDIDALKEIDFIGECFKVLEELKEPRFQDQDILNVVLHKRVLFLNQKWNYFSAPTTSGMYQKTSFENAYKDTLAKLEREGREAPCIVHLIGARKPWRALQTPFSEKFWGYAQKSPYYEELMQMILPLLPERLIYVRKKRKLYFWTSMLTFGKLREKCNWKWDSYNYEVLATERFLTKHGK